MKCRELTHLFTDLIPASDPSGNPGCIRGTKKNIHELIDLIDECLTWHETQEGDVYWCDVVNRLRYYEGLAP